MIYKNIELHNIEDLIPVDGCSGLRMQRIPESVLQELTPEAQAQLSKPACAEIRFVSKNPVSIELSCPEGAGSVDVFYGPFQSPERHIIRHDKYRIDLSLPDQMSLYEQSKLPAQSFSPHVCRLMMAGDAMFIHTIESSNCRPPVPEELPRLRYPAFGTCKMNQNFKNGSASL